MSAALQRDKALKPRSRREKSLLQLTAREPRISKETRIFAEGKTLKGKTSRTLEPEIMVQRVRKEKTVKRVIKP